MKRPIKLKSSYKRKYANNGMELELKGQPEREPFLKGLLGDLSFSKKPDPDWWKKDPAFADISKKADQIMTYNNAPTFKNFKGVEEKNPYLVDTSGFEMSLVETDPVKRKEAIDAHVRDAVLKRIKEDEYDEEEEEGIDLGDVTEGVTTGLTYFSNRANERNLRRSEANNFRRSQQQMMQQPDFGYDSDETLYQNAGGTPSVGGLPPEMEDQATVYVDTGEIARMEDGSIVYIDPSKSNTYNHGESAVSPKGTPITGVHSVLESTSTKHGRDATADRLLRVSMDEAESLTGYRPKKLLSHATLYRQTKEYYDKFRKKYPINIKKAMDRQPGSIIPESTANSIRLNMKAFESLPSDEDLYDIIYQHQEQVKEATGIPDEPTTEQVANYDVPVPGVEGVPMGQNGTPLAQTGRENDYNPDDFPQGATEVRRIKGDLWVYRKGGKKYYKKYDPYNRISDAPNQLPGVTVTGTRKKPGVAPETPWGKGFIMDDKKFNLGTVPPLTPVNTTEPGPAAVTSSSRGDIMNRSIGVPIGKWSKYAEEEIEPADGPIDWMNPPGLDERIHNRYPFLNKPFPTDEDITPYSYKDQMYLPKDYGKGTGMKVDPRSEAVNYPLKLSDLASSLLSYADSFQRIPQMYQQVDASYPDVETISPDYALQQIDTDANNFLANLPMGTAGQAMAANINSKRAQNKADVIKKFAEYNAGVRSQASMAKAEIKNRLILTNAQLAGQYADNILKAKTLQSQQRLQSLDSLFKKVNENRAFNQTANMLKSKDFTVTPQGQVIYTGQWKTNQPTVEESIKGIAEAIDKELKKPK